MSFRYTEAIVCRLPDCLPDNNIDLLKCRIEFENFVTVLRETGLDVIELPPPDEPGQSSFVGDVCFIVNGMAVIKRPKADQTEVTTMMRTVLRKELDIPVVEVVEDGVNLEGADILFTGRELFVGISNYTNEAGALFMANAFPEFPCSPVKLPGGKHLTHYVSMASPDVMTVGACKESQDIIKRIERKASYRYEKITMTSPEHSPVIMSVNGSLVHFPTEEKIYADKLRSMVKCTTELNELTKMDVNFNRLAVLLNKARIKSFV
ncbi:N(G),N(G)-dimethylarginine dimethylaminohydrolase 1 [Orchesella cincta]|uniref:N(G),N(G)-dimethylarginine dimethylaminohydrolase 1 n=1 Tax=Orchesella cincta TaxID=48709 RepID=A0A1D2NMF0_ORCCI|nr:N(G),N(G)-dimethylarginine dimethylaminohydrolase 1 [Orchesella cincta]